jgi:hypothetical protein
VGMGEDEAAAMVAAWASGEDMGLASPLASATAGVWEGATRIPTADSIPGFLAAGGPQVSTPTATRLHLDSGAPRVSEGRDRRLAGRSIELTHHQRLERSF